MINGKFAAISELTILLPVYVAISTMFFRMLYIMFGNGFEGLNAVFLVWATYSITALACVWVIGGGFYIISLIINLCE